MLQQEYHNKIIDYYNSTEHAYKDSWDLDNSLAIHYGFWDNQVKNFSQSLTRMNEVMMEAAAIKPTDKILDAGCGIGGSCFFLVEKTGCHVTGISLSEKQIKRANELSLKKKMDNKTCFLQMNYSATTFPDYSFDVVWGCESVCYAAGKELFLKEAFRILKPGGRLVVADGFVSDFSNNSHPVIRKWLDGWQVNYLESPQRFREFMHAAGFKNFWFRDISAFTMHSSKRLYKFYFLARLYLLWKTLTFSNRSTAMQKKNIDACKFQFLAMKKKLWLYGLTVGIKPG